ncbi:MAG: YesL family protein [Romboutsia sp.]|uniref:YesL family protein n=1 Tax=Romboutsia sp. TaxID=1965302 RepID=UPI003F344445
MKFGDILLNFCDWIWRFIILNFLWVGFTLMGGIIVGIMPSTVATFYILRKWVQGEFEMNLFKTFKDVYKKEFVNSNKCGLVFLVIFAFLGFDLAVLYNIEALYSTPLYIIVSAVLFFVTMSFMYFFPTYVHFSQTNKEYIKNSFIFALSSPIQTILLFIGFGILAYIAKSNPGLLAFFGMVVPGYWIMHVLYKRFNQLQKSTA